MTKRKSLHYSETKIRKNMTAVSKFKKNKIQIM